MEQTTNPPRPGYTKAHPKLGGCLLGAVAAMAAVAFNTRNDTLQFILGALSIPLGILGLLCLLAWFAARESNVPPDRDAVQQTGAVAAPRPWKHLAVIAVVAGVAAPTAAVLALTFPLQLIGLLALVPPAFAIALFGGLFAAARATGVPLEWRAGEVPSVFRNYERMGTAHNVMMNPGLRYYAPLGGQLGHPYKTTPFFEN